MPVDESAVSVLSFRSDFPGRGAVRPLFLASIEWQALPKIAGDRAIFAVYFNNEVYRALEARERGGISVKLLC
jgi:hypothetical protein